MIKASTIDRTLDERVALARGWQKITERPPHWEPICSTTFSDRATKPCRGPWWCPPGTQICHCPTNGLDLPHYSAITEVAIRLLSDVENFTIKKENGRVHVFLHDRMKDGFGTATTVSKAICLAYANLKDGVK